MPLLNREHHIELDKMWSRLQQAMKIHCGIPSITQFDLDEMCLSALDDKVSEFERDNREEE